MSALESELEIREAEVDPASQAPVIVSSGFTSVFGTTTVKQEPSYPSFALPPGSRAFSSGLSRSMVSSVWRRSSPPPPGFSLLVLHPRPPPPWDSWT